MKLQEEFIKALQDTCFETEDIESLKNLIFKIRYYKFLYITKTKQIKSVKKLNDLVNKALGQVIQKLVVSENIKRIANDDKLNQEIISNISDEKIVEEISNYIDKKLN